MTLAEIIMLTVLASVGLLTAGFAARSRLTRRGVAAFLAAGGALALARALFLWYLWHSLRTHTMRLSLSPLLLALHPEASLIARLPAYGPAPDMLLATAVVVAGSFLWALPFLLVGARRPNPRGL